ncbi:MAG: cytochrome c3 family protein [Deltaproteobacteria bacterium]|nr:cytochrome c3 family protein [Deltaproteobacteria bacterium]
MRVQVLRVVVSVLWVAAAGAGCSESLVERQAPLGGSCLACHDGISDVHPYFALACVDCHGGNDRVPLPAVVNVRDKELLRQSHVLPKNPELWWPNGVDDDRDGQVDEQGEFFDGRLIEEGAIAARAQHDSEPNQDLDYLRFLNPGDLRVAGVGCGASNTNANAAMVCHAEVVYDVRRSIMSVHSGVPAGANYGNAQRPRAADFGADFAASEAGRAFDARNERVGRVGYVFNYDEIDAAFLAGDNRFDGEALLSAARQNQDPDDDDQMARAAPFFDHTPDEDRFAPPPGLTRSGQPLKFFSPGDANNRSVDFLMPFPNNAGRAFPPAGSLADLRVKRVLGLDENDDVRRPFDGEPISNPVDAALRAFRAFHSLNFAGTNDNFGLVDFTTNPNDGGLPNPSPASVDLVGQNNPFGRMRPTGCTACHTPYAKDGHNREERDRTVADNGRQPSTDLPFGMRADRGERGYAEKHVITRAVQTETCASCHGFVTRIDYAFTGVWEVESDFTNPIEKIMTIGPYEFTTPTGTRVRVFDNLARVTGGQIENDGEGKSEDKNNNGELDPGEDDNSDGVLDLPDRVERSGSFDGRQTRIVYGGHNGATRLMDIHYERGLGCVDCHSVQDIHGDGNLYARNWDFIEIECDDCHGTPSAPATLVTTGPNGGNNLTAYTTPFGERWLERIGDKVIQHSRQKKGLQWEVPQLTTPKDDASRYAHFQPSESGPEPGRDAEARAYAHIAESGKPGGLECYACHSSWQPNCLTCHMQMDVAKPVQQVWYNDEAIEEVAFQLFSYTRSPFYMGRSGDVEGNKIAPHRSLMELHYSVAAGGTTLADNLMFATENNLSSVAHNPNFPHTVRTAETKGCQRCHTLVDEQARVQNDHLVSEAVGEGTGRYQNVGDWAIVTTKSGFAQLDLKAEIRGERNVWPGFLFSAQNTRRVDSPFAGAAESVLARGVSYQNGSGDVTDVVVVAHDDGLSVVDVFGRDHEGLPPTELARLRARGPVVSVDNLDPSLSQTTRVVALGPEELFVVDYRGALSPPQARDKLRPRDEDEEPFVLALDDVEGAAAGLDVVGAVPHGKSGARRVRLFGDLALVAHDGGVTAYPLAEAGTPVAVDSGAPGDELFTFATPAPAVDMVARGRFLYVACGNAGVAVFDVDSGALVGRALAAAGADARGVALWGSRLLVAGGKNGLHVVDVAVPADPRLEQTIHAVAGQPSLDQASAVVVASIPVRSYAVVADGTNGLRAVNLTPSFDQKTQFAAADVDRDAFRGFRLSPERNDPMTPFDPKNALREVITYPTGTPALAVARGLSLDSLTDRAGRRWRDNWLIGSDALSSELQRRLRAVEVTEIPGSRDVRGDGLGCVVRRGDEARVTFDAAGRCLPRLDQ